MKKIKTLIFAIATSSLILTSCSGEVGFDLGKDSDEELVYEEAQGGEIALPLRMVKSLNPLLASSEDLYHFNKLIYNGLFELGEGLEPVEALARSYSISEGGRVIEIELKDNINWHDETPLKADDVVFTIETIRGAYSSANHIESLSPLYKEGGVYDISKIKAVRARSELSIEIEFHEPSPDILEYLTMPIIPSHKYANLEEAMRVEDYRPVGTGAYEVEKMDMFKQIDLLRNDKYWKGKVNIDRIIGRILKDRRAGKSAFDSGRINAIYDRGDEWEEYTENERIDVSEFASNRQIFIAPNYRKEVFTGKEGLKLREAISLAIDREHILKEIYLGYGYLSETIIDPNSWLSKSEEPNSEGDFDLEKAKEILAELGYIEGASGILEDQDGELLQIVITALPRDARRYNAIEQIASDIEKLGIQVERDYSDVLASDLELEEVEDRLEQFKSKLSSDSYDIALIDYSQSYLPDISQLLHSTYSDTSNYSGYASEELDALFDRLKTSKTKDEKKSIYGEIEIYLKEQLPLIPIVHSQGALISYKRINGDLNPNYFSVYKGIEGWFVPKEFQLDGEENKK